MGQHHEHGRHHGHHHHGAEFDWVAMAEHLELDAAMMSPLLSELVADVDWRAVRRVLDIGCGPGVIACALARTAPAAEVIALDSSEALLARVRSLAERERLADRVRPLHGDLDDGLGGVRDANVVWSSMVMHHAADLGAGLRAALGALTPGGLMVMVEFGEPVVVLPADDPLVATGVWSRYQAAVADALRARLPHDPDTIDWPVLLREAGFAGVERQSRWIEHPAPLHDLARQWLALHLQRGLDQAGDRIAAADVAAITQLRASVPERDDLVVRANRQVLWARRPG